RQTFGDGVFALEDMNVRAADGGGGDANEGIERTNVGNGLLIENDATRLDKDRGFHLGGHAYSPMQGPGAMRRYRDAVASALPVAGNMRPLAFRPANKMPGRAQPAPIRAAN